MQLALKYSLVAHHSIYPSKACGVVCKHRHSQRTKTQISSCAHWLEPQWPQAHTMMYFITRFVGVNVFTSPVFPLALPRCFAFKFHGNSAKKLSENFEKQRGKLCKKFSNKFLAQEAAGRGPKRTFSTLWDLSPPGIYPAKYKSA